MKIWCQYKYNTCHPWIIENLQKQDYDLYLLCDIDLPWQPDPLREHPDKRKFLFDWYYRELSLSGNQFAVVSGLNEQRNRNAIRIIEETFK
jgi:nicotinamide riboside kinase